MNMNLVQCAPNVSRAVEIARLGSFPIMLVRDRSEDSNVRQADIDELIQFYELHGSIAASTDKAFIVVEVSMSPDDILNSLSDRGETLEDIKARADKADRVNELPEFTIDSSGRNLLKSAINKLQLGLFDLRVIKEVSRRIAQLDGADRIKAEHLAEAIMYRSFERN